MKLHILALLIGFCLDLLIGDPVYPFHPIRLMGNGIQALEKKLYPWGGGLLAILMVLFTGCISGGILWYSYYVNHWIGMAVEAILTWQCLAAGDLFRSAMIVGEALRVEGLQAGRYWVSRIVGRDTDALDEAGVLRAAVETVAENTSDGVIAPLLYLAIGGPVLGMVYKAINTMDSMVGYKNEKYLRYGRIPAKLDDVVNYLPARISAVLLILSAALLGKEYSAANGWKIWRRDRRKHASPNSAQTESACAGALGLQLAGPAVYFGKKLDKPTIGDALRPIEIKDIRRAGRLMLLSAWICLGICIGILYGCAMWFGIWN